MKAIFFSVIGLIVTVIIWASINLGFYKEVVIKESDYGPLNLVYKEHIRPYHKILPAIESVESWAKENNLNCTESFGHYLDNPDVVEHERLKSHGGCILKNFTESDFNQLYSHQKEKFPNLKFKSLLVGKFVVAEFEGSPAIGPFKVYNRVSTYFNDKKWEQSADVIEIYQRLEKDKMKTVFLFQIKKSNEF